MTKVAITRVTILVLDPHRDVGETIGDLLRSVGYRGVALPGIPFHEKWGSQAYRR